MKNTFYLLVLFAVCLFLFGCKDTENSNADESTNVESKDNVMNGIDIYDFYFINRAPEAKEMHSIDELIKIYFSVGRDRIAVDVKNNEVYGNPLWSTNGVDTLEDPVNLNDKEGLLKILKKYNVQQWKDDYTTENPDSYQDGYGWKLLLQFEDGTVEKYRGEGPEREGITPDNFDAFYKELNEFVEKKLLEQDNDQKEENEMYEYDIYDFSYIKKTPEATKKHPVSKVIKILFNTGGMSSEDTISIDILNNEIYLNPQIGSRGIRFSDGTVKVKDIELAIKILEKYDVQTWKNDYTFEDPDSYQDGYGWVLRLQVEDGTVERYGGEGSMKSEITPDNFDEFFAELNRFVEERLEEGPA